MKAHAWEYGFVMSYPRGKIDVTCYDFEPWHFRYVGRELAASIHGSGLTPREYLWANFTTTVVPARTPEARPHGATDRDPAVDGRAIRRAVRRPRRCRRRPPRPSTPATDAARRHRGARDGCAARAPASARPAASPPIRACAAGLAIVAGALAVALALLARKVLRRGRSGVGL